MSQQNIQTKSSYDESGTKVDQELSAQAARFVRNFAALKKLTESYMPQEFEEEADAENWERESLAAVHDFDGLKQLVTECIDAGAERDLDNAVRTLCVLGRELYHRGDIEEANNNFDRAIEIAFAINGEYGRYAAIPIIETKVSCGLGEEAVSLLSRMRDWSERANL